MTVRLCRGFKGIELIISPQTGAAPFRHHTHGVLSRSRQSASVTAPISTTFPSVSSRRLVRILFFRPNIVQFQRDLLAVKGSPPSAGEAGRLRLYFKPVPRTPVLLVALQSDVHRTNGSISSHRKVCHDFKHSF